MADDSGRLVWLWGPLLLVAVLVAVFRYAETDGSGSESGEDRRVAPSSSLPTGPSPGAAVTAAMPEAATRAPGGTFAPRPGYPAVPYAAGPAPYPGAPVCPPWAADRPPPYPRPGDHSGRYWGRGAPEWGPPIGEYGPDTRVDPYWWVSAEEADR